jgi:hypothetical protein
MLREYPGRRSAVKGAHPRVSVWKRVMSSRVTGPTGPAPMARPSTVRIGAISAAVPVKKASSAV